MSSSGRFVPKWSTRSRNTYALSASRVLLASMEATLADLHARRTALLARPSGLDNG